MPKYEVEYNGKRYEVEAADPEAASIGVEEMLGGGKPASAGEGFVDKALGVAGTAAKGAAYGASQAARGVGESLKQSVGTGMGTDAAGAAADIAAPNDYTPSKFRATSPSTWGDIGKTLAESAPGLATDLAAGAVGGKVGALAGPVGAGIGSVAGFGASYGLRNWGQNAKDRAAARTGDQNAEPDTSDKTVAGLSTGAGALLSRFGLGPAIGGVGSSVVKGAGMEAVKQTAKEIGKSALAGGVGAAAEQGAIETGRTAGTDADFNWRSVADAAGTGAAIAGGVRTLRAPADLNNARKFSDIDPESGARLTQRFDAQGSEVNTAKGAGTAVKNVRDEIKADLDSYYGSLKKTITEISGDKAGASDLDREVSKLRRELDNKTIIEDGRVDSILDAVETFTGQTKETIGLRNSLKDHNTLNRLTAKGRETNEADIFGGGSTRKFSGGITSNPIVSNFVNPVGAVKTLFKVGGPATAALPGVAALSAPAQAAAVASYAMPIVGAQTALYGGLRGVDKFLGNRHVAKEFTSRFRDKNLPKDLATDRSLYNVADESKRARQLDRELGRYDTVAEQKEAGSSKTAARQSDKAWREKQRQDELVRKASEQRQADFEKALPDPSKLDAQKAAQEEALWGQYEKQTKRDSQVTQDWTDLDAEAAIKESTLKQARASLSFGKRAKALQDRADREQSQQASAQAREQAKAQKQAAAAEAKATGQAQRIESQQSDVFDGLSNKDVAGIRRGIQAVSKRDTMRQKEAAREAKANTPVPEPKEQPIVNADTRAAMQGIRLKEKLKAANAEKPVPEPKEEPLVNADGRAALRGITLREKLKAANQPKPEKPAPEPKEGPTVTSEMRDSVRAIKLREKLKEQNAPKPEKPAPEPKEEPLITSDMKTAIRGIKLRERLKQQNEPKPEPAPKSQQSKPKSDETVEPKVTKEDTTTELKSFKVHGMEIDIPSTVKKPAAWQAKTTARINTRQEFGTEFIDTVPATRKAEARNFVRSLTLTHKTFASAMEALENFVTDMTSNPKNDKYASPVYDVWNKWEDRIKETYDKDGLAELRDLISAKAKAENK
jgi:hypothetical protein